MQLVCTFPATALTFHWTQAGAVCVCLPLCLSWPPHPNAQALLSVSTVTSDCAMRHCGTEHCPCSVPQCCIAQTQRTVSWAVDFWSVQFWILHQQWDLHLKYVVKLVLPTQQCHFCPHTPVLSAPYTSGKPPQNWTATTEHTHSPSRWPAGPVAQLNKLGNYTSLHFHNTTNMVGNVLHSVLARTWRKVTDWMRSITRTLIPLSSNCLVMYVGSHTRTTSNTWCFFSSCKMSTSARHYHVCSAVQVVFFHFELNQILGLGHNSKFWIESNSFHHSQKSPLVSTC